LYFFPSIIERSAEEDGMYRACSALGREYEFIYILVGNSEGKRNYKYLNIYLRIILKIDIR
jgi:hypothetical protein